MKVEDIAREIQPFISSGRGIAVSSPGFVPRWNRTGREKLLTNSAIDKTLTLFQALEKGAAPQEKLNWRFQEGLYRAYYDAYIHARLLYETQIEREAIATLRTAKESGSMACAGSGPKNLRKR